MKISIDMSLVDEMDRNTQGRVWMIRDNSETRVRVDPDDSTKIEIQMEGHTCNVFSIMSREDAALLAQSIVSCLEETEVRHYRSLGDGYPLCWDQVRDSDEPYLVTSVDSNVTCPVCLIYLREEK